MENFEGNIRNGGNSMNDADMAFFERDALAAMIMREKTGISYDDACKKAMEIIKKDREEEKQENEKN